MSTMGPFGQSMGPPPPSIITSGSMSFDSQMHGSYMSHASSSTDRSMMIDLTDNSDTAVKIATLQAKLNKKLGPEFISQRPGPGGGPKLTYAEGWKIINLANDVFGFNGWSSSVVSLSTDFVDYNEESRRYNVGVSAIVRVTLRDGVFHEDVGYGLLENSKSKGAALDKCKKEAVTDGLKRSLRNFGNLLGNCLYDKSYTQEIVKIKVPPAKFDKGELYRRPEFDDQKPPIQKPASNVSSTSTAPLINASISRPNEKSTMESCKVAVKTEQERDVKLSSVPRHLLPESLPKGPVAASTPNAKGKSPAHTTTGSTALNTPLSNDTQHIRKIGLNTPLETPAQKPANQVQAHHRQRPQPNAPETPLQQQQQKVTFVESPPPNELTEEGTPVDESTILLGIQAEDSFHFYSDDDAFLAAVDLGEGDLGRPIVFEEGVGEVSLDDVPSNHREGETPIDSVGGSRGAPAAQSNKAHYRANTSSSNSSNSSGQNMPHKRQTSGASTYERVARALQSYQPSGDSTSSTVANQANRSDTPRRVDSSSSSVVKPSSNGNRPMSGQNTVGVTSPNVSHIVVPLENNMKRSATSPSGPVQSSIMVWYSTRFLVLYSISVSRTIPLLNRGPAIPSLHNMGRPRQVVRD
ncbi:hypothetical protein SERLADRAFT_405547 [Serpula lacrymans var. lacrymans S7.9]|uniref:Uncharacterized protein n=1 Tax=Serpula lacrymans var. lacrymans (strain S7.9) TaxID=578457 RepID=F8NGX4_SERL9|nr:uncharacterized protein SERLADRAFT_405547 [Serpula lacrymans var. lacrymans S7.9]EGO29616.1 hypothetical protein SERLADRAFT_405547 [Serpula lacrymans var. lacrymans S7.9]